MKHYLRIYSIFFIILGLNATSFATGQTISTHSLSYHGSAANTYSNVIVELTNFSTCQSKVEINIYSDIYIGSNIWESASDYDYFVNGTLIGSSTTQNQTLDISSYIPVTSVKVVSKATTWSVVDLTVRVYGVNDPSLAPITTTSVEYSKGDIATALTATLTPSGANLKWYTSEKGDNYSATAPVPSTTTVGTVSYWVSEADANGCESERAKIDVIVIELITGLNSFEINSLTIYPNPIENNLNVKNFQEGDYLILKDINGITQFNQIITSSIQVEELKNGILFFEVIRNGNSIKKGKLIKK